MTIDRQTTRKLLAETLRRVGRYPARMLHDRAENAHATLEAMDCQKLLLHNRNFLNRCEREMASVADA